MNFTADHPIAQPGSGQVGVVVPAVLPDDPVALKALLQAQQAAFEARLATQAESFETRLAAEAQAFETRLAAEAQAFETRLVAEAQAFEARRATEIQAFEARIQHLYEQIRLARQRMFGRSSESHSGQGWLFDEAEALAATALEGCDSVTLPASQPAQSTLRQRGKRRPLPVELPRVDIIHDVPEAERHCACGTLMVEIGEEVSEQLDIVPMQIRVLRHIRKRYACPNGDRAPQVAPVPAQVLPKSNASNDLLAMLLTTKYVDGLPLARFEYVLARAGVTVPRQTLARWVIGTAQVLQPVANLLRDTLLDADVIHMDETPLQVLKEPGRAARSGSYMWVQRGGPPDKPVILFDYDASRSKAVPLRLLAGWRGYLMTDGYEAYTAVVAREGITHLGCWVHARRNFVDALKTLPTGTHGRANQALAFIAKLYAIEKACRDLSIAERFEVRQSQSRPILGELRAWLDGVLHTVPPKTALGQALGYLDRYWVRLVRYLERGDLPIDNNRAENAIRPFVVGRKAWLFSDTQAGAQASALIYSLVETAKANGLEPYLWLRTVLRELPKATTVEHIEALLPWNQNPANLAME